jgi:hypothetical protein
MTPVTAAPAREAFAAEVRSHARDARGVSQQGLAMGATDSCPLLWRRPQHRELVAPSAGDAISRFGLLATWGPPGRSAHVNVVVAEAHILHEVVPLLGPRQFGWLAAPPRYLWRDGGGVVALM